MANSRRGVDAKLLHFCPNCHSNKIVHNGRHHQDKIQFFCNSCGKYFYEDPAKGYPPTSIPFPVISYLLYFRRKVPEFSNMRKFRKFANHWLQHLRIDDQDVSRQTIHHWIQNFDSYLDKVITFDEARDFCQIRIKKLSKVRPPEEVIPYRRTLRVLECKFGKTTLVHLIKEDEDFFRELVDIVSKHGVFGWEFLEVGFGGDSVGYRSLSTG